MDFNVKNLWVINICGVEVWITQTIFNTWIIMLVLIAAAIVIRIKLRGLQEIPAGAQNAVEAVIELFDDFVRNTAGEKLMNLGNWFFMVFVFVIASNLSSLVGLRPPTADWGTVFALALATLVLIQVMGAVHTRGAYLKKFFKPNPIFFPLNLIGELARPVALSFRLFGNILAGMILISLFYTLAPIYARFFIPVVLHAYFDLFSGALHTYIFCVLSLTFIGAAASSSEN